MERNFKQMLNDRFGLFVHYGIYSEMGGKFNRRSPEDGMSLMRQINEQAQTLNKAEQ